MSVYEDEVAQSGAQAPGPLLGVRRDTPASSAGTDGDYATVNLDANGRVYTAVGGTAASDIGKAEDAAHASGDTGVPSLAVRRDTAAVGSGTDGDYSTLNVNASGRLYTSATVDAALPAGTNNIGDVDIVSLPAEVGAVTETAPATDTASSGLNGRLQRIAQNITTLIASILKVGGNVANDAVDSGNPVKIGGRAFTFGKPAVASDDRVDAYFGLRGHLAVMANEGTPADNASPTANAFLATDDVWRPLWVTPSLYNEVGRDQQRNNTEVTLLASAARTATTNSPDQTNYNGRGVHVSLSVTVEGPATLAIKIQGKHSVSAEYYDIVDFGTVYTAATDAPGPKTVALYPGILTADHVGVGAGVSGTIGKSAVLPRIWRAVVTHADATTCTYSLTAVTIL